jgi:hypothetical protein
VSAPSISLPKDVDWKSISPELAFRIMSIDHRVEYADQTIRAVGDLVAAPPDYEEYFEERIAQYAEVGLAAFALANELRQTYRIPNSEVGSWEPKVRLGKAAAGIKKSRKAARKRNAEEWKAMSSERETTKKT